MRLIAAILIAIILGGCAQMVFQTVGEAVLGPSFWQIDKESKARQKELEDKRQKELEDKHIGYQSSPVTVPHVGELRLLVFPLNTNDRRGMEPFVICVAARGTTGEPKEKPQ